MEWFIALGIGALFGVAIYQILQRNAIRSAIGIILLGSAINLFLLSAGRTNGEFPSYVEYAGGLRPDALPQAMVLTAIVISMGGLAVILAMLYMISLRQSTTDLDEFDQLKH